VEINFKADPNSAIAKSLRFAIAEFEKKPTIEAAFSLPGDEHDYWWYIEFGTATKHQSVSRDGLVRPTSIPANQGRSTPYPIVPREQFGPTGKKRRLRFVIGNRVFYRLIVLHPGLRPANRGRGVVRVAVREAQIELEKELKRLRTRRNAKGFPIPPTRRELVTAVNKATREAFATMQRLTPLDPRSKHPTHLRDAWSYRKAT
jgi:hypothetical protein